MAFLSIFTSDEVKILGLDREVSQVYKDNNNAPYFDILCFDLSDTPSDKWRKTFKEHAAGFIDADIKDTCHFEGATLNLSATKIYAQSLQEFIDSLKKVFDSVNDSLKQERDSEAEQEKNLNDLLDNLKF